MHFAHTPMFWRLLFMVAVHPLTTEWVETLRFVKFLRGTKFVKSWIRNDEKQICSLVFHTCHSGRARLWGRTEEKTQPGLFICISFDAAAPRLSSEEMTQPASSWHCRSGYTIPRIILNLLFPSRGTHFRLLAFLQLVVNSFLRLNPLLRPWT